MFLKIMSEENMPDHSNAKSYLLIECEAVQFGRDEKGRAWAAIEGSTYKNVALTGNAYVLNSNGRTVDSFAYTVYSEEPMPEPIRAPEHTSG